MKYFEKSIPILIFNPNTSKIVFSKTCKTRKELDCNVKGRITLDLYKCQDKFATSQQNTLNLW